MPLPRSIPLVSVVVEALQGGVSPIGILVFGPIAAVVAKRIEHYPVGKLKGRPSFPLSTRGERLGFELALGEHCPDALADDLVVAADQRFQK